MSTISNKVQSYFQTPLLVLALFAALYAFKFTDTKDRTVSVAADKMNIFYVGVDNPITVAVEGIKNKDVTVSSSDVRLMDKGKGRYIVIADQPGEAQIQVSAKGMQPQVLKFRVKRFSDPIATLDNPNFYLKTEGNVKAEDFKETVGILQYMFGCFDFDNKLKVSEFTILKVPKTGCVVEVFVRNGKFNDAARQLINSATSGDTFYFETIISSIDGGSSERKLNNMAFTIK